MPRRSRPRDALVVVAASLAGTSCAMAPHRAGRRSSHRDRNALRVAENVGGIERRLDLLQAREVRAPIGGRIVGQLEVAIVDVGRTRYIGPHGGVDLAHVGETL